MKKKPKEATLGANIADLLQDINPVIVRNFERPHEIDLKPDASIVTRTDVEVEQALTPELQRLAPGSAVVGEESAPVDLEAAVELFGAEYLWAVDPIDGTVNFASGLPLFAVSVGLLKRERDGYAPVLGAISFPMLAEIYYTREGRTWRRDMRTKSEVPVERSNRGMAPLFLAPSDFRLAAASLENPLLKNMRQLGCTVANLLYVAIGRATATFTQAHLWDIAAPLAVAGAFALSPQEPVAGVRKTHLSPADFALGGAGGNWKLKKPLVLCRDDFFPQVQALLRTS